jgi:hypothetical protein
MAKSAAGYPKKKKGRTLVPAVAVGVSQKEAGASCDAKALGTTTSAHSVAGFDGLNAMSTIAMSNSSLMLRMEGSIWLMMDGFEEGCF